MTKKKLAVLRLISNPNLVILLLGCLSSCLNFSENTNTHQAVAGYLDESFSLLPEHIRCEESAFGSHVADAMMEAALAQCDPGGLPCPHIAIFNSGSIRGPAKLNPGPITFSMLDEILPFKNELLVVRLKGEDIRYALEHSVARIDQKSSSPAEFLQVAGIEFYIDCDKQPQTLSASGDQILHRGKRAERILITSGIIPKPLENKHYYEVLTTRYLAEGRNGFLGFLHRSHGNIILRDADERPIAKYNFLEDVVLDEGGEPLTIKHAFSSKLKALHKKGIGLSNIPNSRIFKKKNCLIKKQNQS